jgi:hypothetical protein
VQSQRGEGRGVSAARGRVVKGGDNQTGDKSRKMMDCPTLHAEMEAMHFKMYGPKVG